MKKHVGIITGDTVLYSKIRLLLRDTANVTIAALSDDANVYDVLLLDARVGERMDAIVIGDGGRLPLSFRHEELITLIDESGEPDEAIALSPVTHEAYVLGETVRLTEVEYKLLKAIITAEGFVSKEELLNTVWGDGYDLGVVNVYVHYLRRKLEKDGKKLIISSRNEGYKISDKYRRKS
jgi:DNA-binding response OmpR family regulator